MEMSLSLIRVLFVFLSILFASLLTVESFAHLSQFTSASIGAAAGTGYALLMLGAEQFLKRYNLRSLNIFALGLLFGWVFGYSLLSVFNAFVFVSGIELHPLLASSVKTALFLSGIYITLVMTVRSSEQLYMSIPFVKLKPLKEKKKDILADVSILSDTRIIDLASSGLLDHQLVIPRFILGDLQDSLEHGDEVSKNKARRALEILKRLEDLQQLGVRYADTDFPEVKDHSTKIVKMARLLDSNIVTADINRIQQSAIESEGIRIINVNTLSSALKPITHTGEYIQIKIQRYGKESGQGVGYLEDGTMVVVNGGADFLGEIIKAQVLSVKHTSSGRMIFCNASEEEIPQAEAMEISHNGSNPRNYFSV